MAGFRVVSFTLTLIVCIMTSRLPSNDASIIKIVSENDILEIDIADSKGSQDPSGEPAGMVVESQEGVLQWEKLTIAAENHPVVKEEAEEEEEEEEGDIWVARPCDPKKCKLPYCRCSGVDIPGDIKPTKAPQMVLLSFSNAIRQQDSVLYDKLFDNRTNPNGCPATGTFFASHNYSDYYEVQRLYSKRHEVADNGVSEVVPDFWRTASCKQWAGQIADQRTILSTFGGVKADDIRGFRAPFLFMGGDRMYCGERTVSGVHYDATRVELDTDTHGKGFYWPYTYDYLSTQPCVTATCPNNTFPGLWQLPLAALTDAVGNPCADLATCNVSNEDEAYNMLRNGFQDHYTTNRAPLMLQIKVDWLLNDFKMAATKRFMDSLADYKDVYVVSAWQALQWVQKPTSGKKPAAFSCDAKPPTVCKASQVATCYFAEDRKNLKPGSPGIKYVMRMCNGPCPKCYPAVGDPKGRSC